MATVLTSRKPGQRNRRLFAGLALALSDGEIPEGLPGSESVAFSERSVRNLGDPLSSFLKGRTHQPKEERLTG